MALKLKTGPKVILALLIGATAIFGLKVGIEKGLLPGAKLIASLVPKSISLPSADVLTSAGNVKELPAPSSEATSGGTKVKALIWAWNAQMGWLYANGGPVTTKGSLMEKNGVNLTLERQDDGNQMQAELVKFANNYKGGKPGASDTQFIAIMGDGAAAALASLNPKLEKLGKEYRAVIVGSAGYSRGEDKFMGPKEWRDTPYKAKGGLVAGVLRDGDWNIAQKWCFDNKVKNNPNEKTYDPDALNWLAVDSYTAAAERYVQGYSEEREVVKNGKKTGEKIKVTVQGVVTWTPGDVTAFEKKGGLVSIADTRKYAWQMPNVIIGIKKYVDDNPQVVEGMLTAIFDAGDQVKSFPKALKKAAAISHEVYKEKDTNPEYWETYYKGMEKSDKVTGEKVFLGGSSVNNLADNMQLFGLLPGQSEANCIYRSVYTVFGDTVVEQYPSDVPSYPQYDSIVETKFIKNIAARSNVDATSAEKPKYTGGNITATVSKRAWNINFDTGKATLTRDAEREMQKLYDQLNVTSLAIEVHGHTDNVGSPEKNKELSEKRAFAVKKWLQAKSDDSFPDERFSKIMAHGQDNPVDSNATAGGKAKNRRVEIVLGTTN